MSRIKHVQWVKARCALVTDPKVIHMASTLIRNPAFRRWYGLNDPASCDVARDVTRDERSSLTVTASDAHLLQPVVRLVVGALVPVWSTALERVSDDMVMRYAELTTIDAIAGAPGLGQAMAGVGWVKVLPNDEGIFFPNLGEHNAMDQERSSSAKTGAERMRDHRDRKRRIDKPERDVTRDRRVEKKRKEKELPPSPPDEGDGARGDPAEHKKAESICSLLTAKGITDAHPGHPTLRAYIKQGVTIEQFEAAAEKTIRNSQRMNYLFEVLRGMLKEAQGIEAGPGPYNGPWDRGRSSIEATAALHGLSPWDQQASQLGQGESFLIYTDRVRKLEEANPMAGTRLPASLD